MTDVEPPRRSRFAWPTTTEPATTPAGTHDHRVKNTPLGLAFLGIVLLFLVNVGLVGYVLVARETRDEQTRITNQRINDGICDLLDQLPEGGLLDRPRQKYGCGPGIPFEELAPEEQEQIMGRAPAAIRPPAPVAPSPTTPAPAPDPMGGAVQVPPAEAARPGAPEPAPTPTPTAPPTTPPPPLVDLEPVTDPICDALGVCL
jgi:hypothetical protein